jgi:hypothetical protein
MPGDWSRVEVEATVADYFAMLEAELRGAPYSKTAHRNALRPLLVGRTDAAIERKHMNISAVLSELGHPWIDGYKPYGNYQDLLAIAGAERLNSDRTIVELVAAQAREPATPPVVTSLSDIWVEPPDPTPADAPRVGEGADIPYRPGRPRFPDYLEIEAANRSLGRAGEELVMRFEAERLHKTGHARLAERLEHVSVSKGDGLGYDILSFETDGQERLIEVKTTSFGKRTPFYISRNELACSKHRPREYHLYRLFEFRRSPRLFGLIGPIDITCQLRPSQFIGRVA